MKNHILIIGATSCIAESVARRYAERGAKMFLVARNLEKLNVLARDLEARGSIGVTIFVLDANDTSRLPEMLTAAWSSLDHVDMVLVAHGTLPNQLHSETNLDYMIHEFRNNAESVIACLAVLGKRLEDQGRGVIAVIGSVAGDRGRASNYLYGSAKAAVDAFASGLRSRLFKSGVHVLTIKPGFVDTPMTKGLLLPKFLVVTADKVADDIIRAVERKQNVLYTPWFWRFIMLLIKHIPELIFKKIKF